MIVLCYHAVSPDWPSALAIAPKALRRHVTWLQGRGLVGRTFTAAVTAPDSATFAVTFDDAYASVPEQAFPVLSELGVPGTVFVPTAHAGTGKTMAWPGIDEWVGTEWEHELRSASWDQLGELAGAGWEIGSHSQTHPRLTTLADGELAAELENSRLECERQIGVPCTSIAYPYGDTDARVVAASAAAGYSTGGALDGPVSSKPERLRWPRVGAYTADTRLRLGLKLWLFERPALWNGIQRARSSVRRARPT